MVESRPRPDSRRHRRTARLPGPVGAVLILGVLAWLGPFSLDAYSPAFPAIAGEFDATESAVQLTLTALVLGLAIGQFVAGPLTDVYGRRRPLLASLVAYVLATLGCALAPDIWTLVATRFLQGFTVAMSLVVSRAVGRDLFTGRQLTRFYSHLAAITAFAPAVGPLTGAQLMLTGSWRSIFVAVAVMGAAAFLLVATMLPETHARRSGTPVTAQLRASFAGLTGLFRHRSFRTVALTLGLSSAVGLVYLAGAPFVLQDIHGLSPRQYALVFVGNAVTLMLGAQVSSQLATRFPVRVVTRTALCLQLVATVVLLVLVLVRAGLVPVLATLAAVILGHGLVQPNLLALGMQDQPERAGSAAALLGIAQFVVGGAVAPLIGLIGPDVAVGMASTMVVLCAAAVVLALRIRRPDHHRRNGSVTEPIRPGHGTDVH